MTPDRRTLDQLEADAALGDRAAQIRLDAFGWGRDEEDR